jgi:ribonuclease E
MKRMLFNATHSEELRVAIVDGQRLIDLDIETTSRILRKGNIYRGVITRIEPGLEACFVNYGSDRHGFLPFKEIARSYLQQHGPGRPKVQELIKEDTVVLVQVDKDERGNKGASLTTFISLAGRYLVLMPNNPRGGGISRRIEGEERQELRDTLAQLKVPQGMSLIARTAGIGRSLEELEWDMNYLVQLWQAIDQASQQEQEPQLIYEESSLVFRAIRDYYQPDVGEILIDDPKVYEQARQFVAHVMPRNANRVKHYHDSVPLFSRFQIEHQIETAYSRSVALPSGGAIVIDHTEALVSIDVNSGRANKGSDIEDTAIKTNLEAAEEIARQLRLRDLGGLVVIDFIDMDNQKNQRDVEHQLRESLKFDRARVQMGRLSRFGLLELSRQRLQPSLGETSHHACPRCHGVGFIRGIESSALHILRLLQEEVLKEHTTAVRVQVPVEVATYLLNEKRGEVHDIETSHQCTVILIPNAHMDTPHFHIQRIKGEESSNWNHTPSYEYIELSTHEQTPEASKNNPVAKQQAMVQGIKPQQPAPLNSKSLNLWNRLKSLFNQKQPTSNYSVTPEKSAITKTTSATEPLFHSKPQVLSNTTHSSKEVKPATRRSQHEKNQQPAALLSKKNNKGDQQKNRNLRQRKVDDSTERKEKPQQKIIDNQSPENKDQPLLLYIQEPQEDLAITKKTTSKTREKQPKNNLKNRREKHKKMSEDSPSEDTHHKQNEEKINSGLDSDPNPSENMGKQDVASKGAKVPLEDQTAHQVETLNLVMVTTKPEALERPYVARTTEPVEKVHKRDWLDHQSEPATQDTPLIQVETQSHTSRN